jgi:hypothetical protein
LDTDRGMIRPMCVFGSLHPMGTKLPACLWGYPCTSAFIRVPRVFCLHKSPSRHMTVSREAASKRPPGIRSTGRSRILRRAEDRRGDGSASSTSATAAGAA